jgi:hypothetical protein
MEAGGADEVGTEHGLSCRLVATPGTALSTTLSSVPWRKPTCRPDSSRRHFHVKTANGRTGLAPRHGRRVCAWPGTSYAWTHWRSAISTVLSGPGAVANDAESRKRNKYRSIAATYFSCRLLLRRWERWVRKRQHDSRT